MEDVAFNGRELSGERRRVFVCRTTLGGYLVVPAGAASLDDCAHFATPGEVKGNVFLRVHEAHVPFFDDAELPAVLRFLDRQGAA